MSSASRRTNIIIYSKEVFTIHLRCSWNYRISNSREVSNNTLRSRYHRSNLSYVNQAKTSTLKLNTIICFGYNRCRSSPKGWFPLSRFWLGTLTHVKLILITWIKNRQDKRMNLNEKSSEVQILRLRATFHALHLFYLRT